MLYIKYNNCIICQRQKSLLRKTLVQRGGYLWKGNNCSPNPDACLFVRSCRNKNLCVIMVHDKGMNPIRWYIEQVGFSLGEGRESTRWFPSYDWDTYGMREMNLMGFAGIIKIPVNKIDFSVRGYQTQASTIYPFRFCFLAKAAASMPATQPSPTALAIW